MLCARESTFYKIFPESLTNSAQHRIQTTKQNFQCWVTIPSLRLRLPQRKRILGVSRSFLLALGGWRAASIGTTTVHRSLLNKKGEPKRFRSGLTNASRSTGGSRNKISQNSVQIWRLLCSKERGVKIAPSARRTLRVTFYRNSVQKQPFSAFKPQPGNHAR